MTKALLRSQDQAPRATLLEMPSAQPGDLDRPPATLRWGVYSVLPCVTTSADARTCPLQGGLPKPALDGMLQGCFARGLWLSALLFHHAREMAVLLLTVTATS